MGLGGGRRPVDDRRQLLPGVRVGDRLSVGVGLLRQPLQGVVLVRDRLPLPVRLRVKQAVGPVGVALLGEVGEDCLLQPLQGVVLVAGGVAVRVGDRGQEVVRVRVRRLAVRGVDRRPEAPLGVVAQLRQLSVRVGDVREDELAAGIVLIVEIGGDERLARDRRERDRENAALCTQRAFNLVNERRPSLP